MNHPSLHIKDENGILVVQFNQRLFDRLSVEQVGQTVFEEVDERDQPRVAMSFEHVQDISSAILGVIIKLHKDIQARGGELRLNEMSDHVRSVFHTMNLHRILHIDQTQDESMAHLTASQQG